MGLHASKGSSTQKFNLSEGYTCIGRDRQTSGSVIKDKKNGSVYFVREVSTTSEEEYSLLLSKCDSKKQLGSKGHEHYLGLEEFITKVDSTFCSSFYKITLVYQYSEHNLQEEIEARYNQKRKFEQAEIWSILCSCSLALAFLQRNKCAPNSITPQEILLTDTGTVKLLDPQAKSLERSGCVSMKRNRYYPPQILNRQASIQHKGSVFSLGMCLMELMLLQPINDCYDFQEETLNQGVLKHKIASLKKLGFSQTLVGIVSNMLTICQQHRMTILKVEEYLFELVESSEIAEVSGIKAATIPSRGDSGTVSQKTMATDDVLPPEIQGLKPVIPQEQMESNPCAFESRFQLQQPDDQEDQNEQANPPTDRNLESSKKLKSTVGNCNSVYYKPMTVQYAVPSIDSTQVFKQSARNAQHNIKPLSTVRQLKQEQGLFTDPKLLEMLRADIGSISKRKGERGKQGLETSYCVKTTVSECMPARIQHNRSSKSSQSINTNPDFSPIQTFAGPSSKIKRSENSRSVRFPDQSLDISFQNPHKSTVTQNSSMKKDKENTRSINQQLEFVKQSYPRGQYQGQKWKDFRHGFGTFYYKQGGRYTGDWCQNKMHGRGTLYYQDNIVAYEGEWREDKLWGRGTLYNKQPKPFKGSYNFRSWEDIDDYWVRFEGNFIDDNKRGEGTLFLSNGERFEGYFQNDQANGDGIFYRKEGSTVRGKWKDNKLVRLY